MNAIKELEELLTADEISHCQRYLIAREIALKAQPVPKDPTEKEAEIFLSFYKQILRMNENAIRKFSQNKEK